MFTTTFVQRVALRGPGAKGVIIRAQTCCLYVLLTCFGVFSGVSLSCVRKTNRRPVTSSRGGSTQGNIINKFKAQLSLKRHAWVTSLGQIWCVFCHKYYVTGTYGGEPLPESSANFLGTMRFYWGALHWEISFLRRHISSQLMSSGRVGSHNFRHCSLHNEIKQHMFRAGKCGLSNLIFQGQRVHGWSGSSQHKRADK